MKYNYIKKLEEKNIKVEPLEIYIKGSIKILHKCICGNKWEVSPANVLAGSKCGCQGGSLKDNNWYIKKLEEKNINVKPLESYKGMQHKILHKCICGNEWKVLPMTILANGFCGCKDTSIIKDNNWYIKKLEEKNINVKPLESYKGMQHKILHKCICGNEWKVLPNNIMQGGLCNCNRIHIHDKKFYSERETVLYYAKLKGFDIWKVGVTLYRNGQNNMKIRYGKEFDLFEDFIELYFEDGSEAFEIEQDIIKSNNKYLYKGPKILSGGNTELFSRNIWK